MGSMPRFMLLSRADQSAETRDVYGTGTVPLANHVTGLSCRMRLLQISIYSYFNGAIVCMH